jgi:hypothetical protein
LTADIDTEQHTADSDGGTPLRLWRGRNTIPNPRAVRDDLTSHPDEWRIVGHYPHRRRGAISFVSHQIRYGKRQWFTPDANPGGCFDAATRTDAAETRVTLWAIWKPGEDVPKEATRWATQQALEAISHGGDPRAIPGVRQKRPWPGPPRQDGDAR